MDEFKVGKFQRFDLYDTFKSTVQIEALKFLMIYLVLSSCITTLILIQFVFWIKYIHKYTQRHHHRPNELEQSTNETFLTKSVNFKRDNFH